MSTSPVPPAVRQNLFRARIGYLMIACVVMPLGLASRRYRAQLPVFVGEFSGDALWALMLYLLVSLLLAGRPLATRALISLILACLVEVSQCYHAA